MEAGPASSLHPYPTAPDSCQGRHGLPGRGRGWVFAILFDSASNSCWGSQATPHPFLAPISPPAMWKGNRFCWSNSDILCSRTLEG